MDKKNRYEKISVEELLHDDYFISSMLSPTAESGIFWDKMLADGEVDPVCFARARELLRLLSLSSRQYGVCEDRIDAVHKRINESVANSKTKVSPAPPKGQCKIHTMAWPVAVMISAACIAAALFLYPYFRGGGSNVPTINGIPVTTMNYETTDMIMLSSADKSMLIEGDEAHLDYSAEGLKVNEQQIGGGICVKENLNMLSVPFGKRSMITFPDGSHLWVNAGTKVMYPNDFTGISREIYVNGEIFGQIAHDPARPFIIKTARADVTVLGTTLNINAYETENEIAAVLVEGRVNVTNRKGVHVDLMPDQMYYESDGQYRIQNVDVQNHISWKDGVYKFDNERIENIIKALSRYYNVCVRASDSVKGLTCSGELILKDDFANVLDGICKTARIVYCWDARNEMYYLDH